MLSLVQCSLHINSTTSDSKAAMMNAKQVEQYIDVAQTTLDRANEVSTLLIPIWQTVYHNQNSEHRVDKANLEEIAILHERVIESLKSL